MIEPEHGFFADSFLEPCPLAVAEFVGHEDEVLIVLEGEVLALELVVELRRKDELEARTMELFAFLLDEFLPFSALVEHLFAALDLLEEPFAIAQLVETVPEGHLVGPDFIERFGLDELLDGLDVVPAESFTPENEIVELLPSPISEPTSGQVVHLDTFIRSKPALVEFLRVFLLLLLLSVTAEFLDELLLSEVILLLLQQCLQSLPVLIEVVLLQFDHLASDLLLMASLSVEHVVEVVVKTLLITPRLILEMHLQRHGLIKRLLVLLGLLVLLEVIEYVDLPEPEIEVLVLQPLETLIDSHIHLISPLLTPLQQQINVLSRYLLALKLEYVRSPELRDLTQLVLTQQTATLLLHTPLLDHQRVPPKLDLLTLDDLLLHGVLTHNPVHHDLALLSDSMSTVHRLQVHLRVEIGIVDDH
jgi:hypothetical protein